MNSLKPIIGTFPADNLRQGWTKMTGGDYWQYNHYGTKGMFSPFAWAPWRMRGTIEQGSKYKPGIRCASLSDAWKLFYGLTRIELADASGRTSGVPRWQASGAGRVVVTRRADPDLWLNWNYVEESDGVGGTYKKFSRPPEVLTTRKDVKKWWDILPARQEDWFMSDTYDDNGEYLGSEAKVRWWPWWYAETSAGKLTGAVYMQISSGFSGRYYRYASSYYAIQVSLGCHPCYYDYAVQPKTFVINKQACGVSFELYGCYFATRLGNLGLSTPTLTEPQKRFQGEWS